MSNFDIDFDAVKTFTELFADTNHPFDWRILKRNGGGQNLRGSLEQLKTTLQTASHRGDQIFIMINESDGEGQTSGNVVAVRALFADLDGVPLENIERFKLTPHIVVETSPDKFHAYWLVLDVPITAFTQLQKQLADLIKSDPSVSDPPRIMRVARAWHLKEKPFQSRIVSLNWQDRYTHEQIKQSLHTTPPPAGTTDLSPLSSTKPYTFEKGLPNGKRTKALTHLAGKLIRQGVEESVAMAKLLGWNNLNTPPLLSKKIQSTYQSLVKTHNRNHSTASLSVADIDRDYAVVVMNGSTKILRENPTLCFLSERDFHLRFTQHQIIDTQGKSRPVSKVWLAGDHRTYDEVVFDPSNKHENYQYNLWKGFAVAPAQGDCALYLANVKDCICDGDSELYEYVMNWAAHLVQKPAELPGVALVLIGDPGTGKGSFVEPLGQILGMHYQHATQMDKVLGRFNIHMASALLVFCDEVVWGGNKREEGTLKGLVTEHDRLVEGKFQNPLTLPSYLRLIFATNEAWAVPTSEKERRWCVLNVNNKYLQNTVYFDALKTQMKNGGTQALLHHLQNRDISEFNVRQVPKTKGLLEQKQLSQDAVASWWFDRLIQGEFGGTERHHNYLVNGICSFDDFNLTDELLGNYLLKAKTDRHGHGKVSNGQQLIRSLKRLCDIEVGRRQISGERQRGVIIPPLAECRLQYERFIGDKVDWQDIE